MEPAINLRPLFASHGCACSGRTRVLARGPERIDTVEVVVVHDHDVAASQPRRLRRRLGALPGQLKAHLETGTGTPHVPGAASTVTEVCCAVMLRALALVAILAAHASRPRTACCES